MDDAAEAVPTAATEQHAPGERQNAALTWALVLAGGLAPLLVVVLPTRSPVSFAITLVLQIVLLGCLIRCVISWLRPGRAAGRRDYVLAAVPLVGAVLSFVTVSMAAAAAGIQGSALPRVLNGVRNSVPLATDLCYLGSIAAIFGVVLSSVVLIVVLARRRVIAGIEGVGSAAASAAKSVSAKPRQDRGLVPVTHVSDGVWRRLMSPSVWVVFALNAVIAVPALWVLAADPAGDLGLLGFLFVFPGVPVAAWAALQTLWRPDEEAGYIIAALIRGALVSVVTVVPLTVVHIVMTLLPVFVDRVERYQRPDAYLKHYWFSGESGAINVIDGSVVQTIFISMLGGFAFSLIATIVITVFVVWPVTAVRNPTALLRESQLSQDPEHTAANVFATRASSVLVMLALLIPTLMVPTDSDDALWWIGLLLIPALVVLTYLVWRRQRVDHAARSGPGGLRGLPNPDDPPPSDKQLR